MLPNFGGTLLMVFCGERLSLNAKLLGGNLLGILPLPPPCFPHPPEHPPMRLARMRPAASANRRTHPRPHSHTHARTHAHTLASTHAHTHARTHAHTHANRTAAGGVLLLLACVLALRTDDLSACGLDRKDACAPP